MYLSPGPSPLSGRENLGTRLVVYHTCHHHWFSPGSCNHVVDPRPLPPLGRSNLGTRLVVCDTCHHHWFSSGHCNHVVDIQSFHSKVTCYPFLSLSPSFSLPPTFLLPLTVVMKTMGWDTAGLQTVSPSTWGTQSSGRGLDPLSQHRPTWLRCTKQHIHTTR